MPTTTLQIGADAGFEILGLVVIASAIAVRGEGHGAGGSASGFLAPVFVHSLYRFLNGQGANIVGGQAERVDELVGKARR